MSEPALQLSDQDLPLQRIWRWEQERGAETYLTQPLGGGALRNLSWAEAVGEARRMAAHLRSFGWEPGARVAIISKNCAWWLLADYAIWMAGCVSVPVYPTLTAHSVRQILEHSEARACFVGRLDAWDTMRPGIPDHVHRVRLPLAPDDAGSDWDAIVAATAPLQDRPVRDADDLATIIYTSGTTGMPKGVMHSFRNIAVSIKTIAAEFRHAPEDRLLSHLPLAHVGERLLVETTSYFSGCRVFFSEGLETFAQDMRRARPTLFGSVPRLWTKFQQGLYAKLPKEQLDALLQDPQERPAVARQVLTQLGLDAVRVAVTGAAPLPPDIVQWYRDLGLELLEIYGMTENFALSHCSRVGRNRVGYVGHAWPGVDTRLDDNGEILVKTPAAMLGYYKEPELTRQAFTADGYLRTGDVGELDEDGRLRITGRAKEQFKTSKGKYVAPAPIENKLGAHPKVEACCVAGASFPQPFALLMLAPGEWERCRDEQARAALMQSLQAHLEAVNELLDPHEQMDFVAVIPEQWTIDNGFITPTFKVKRAAIESHYGSLFAAWARSRETVVWQT
ncbi:MAG: AMP-binding protein [Nevskia sp.]|nr:AMP-binding protein [Nevskia sp.]